MPTAGQLTTQHDPTSCANCEIGVEIIEASLKGFEEKTGSPAPIPITLMYKGCSINWEPA